MPPYFTKAIMFSLEATAVQHQVSTEYCIDICIYTEIKFNVNSIINIPVIVAVAVIPVHPVGLPQLLFGITVN